MDLAASAGGTMWRHPDARAVRDTEAWRIDWQATEPVLPCDVTQADDVANPPKRLRQSLHEVVSSFRTALGDGLDEAEQAVRLAEHYRRFGGPELCVHGRPMWHEGRPEAPSTCRRGADEVAAAVTFARALDALEEGGVRAMKRQDLSPWIIDALEPLLPSDLAPTVRHERARDRRLSPARRRQVLELAGTTALSDAAVRPRVVWSLGRGPGLMLSAGAPSGLYVLDVVRALGRAEPAPTYICQQCGDTVQLKRPPGPGEGTYCRRAECQRARVRINKARTRARAKGDHDAQ